MHVDLITIYFLAIGTLLVSAGMTLWERFTNPRRSRELKILALGYTILSIGCAAAALRPHMPGASGSALSNLIIMTGYLLVLHGVASFNHRRHVAATIGVLGGLAVAWIISGVRWEGVMWQYLTAFPIALVAALTARELFICQGLRRFLSRRIAAAVFTTHALFYAFRAFILPMLAFRFGTDLLPLVSKITMYEGVLFSVAMPMTLIRLVRDESHGHLLRETHTDYLTGLGNRRRFFEKGERVIGASRLSGPISLLAFDLDHFKVINDRYGHETGDRVLKSFADIAQRAAGPDAVLARIGGEEFAALLPGCNGAQAEAVGEAIAERFAASVSHSLDGEAVSGTVSIGLAQADTVTPSLTGLLAAADRALYRAKSLGGNRLEVAQMRREDTPRVHAFAPSEARRQEPETGNAEHYREHPLHGATRAEVQPTRRRGGENQRVADEHEHANEQAPGDHGDRPRASPGAR